MRRATRRTGTPASARHHLNGELHLARKPNYDFEKRRKEMDRQAKKEAKREERARRKREGAAGDEAAGDEAAGDGSDGVEQEPQRATGGEPQ